MEIDCTNMIKEYKYHIGVDHVDNLFVRYHTRLKTKQLRLVYHFAGRSMINAYLLFSYIRVKTLALPDFGSDIANVLNKIKKKLDVHP